MHYRLASGIVIKTENAAKPESQPSNYLLNLLCTLSPVRSTFDYGCGKLRYQSAIASTTDTLAIVDSEVQLSRSQTLQNKITSIREVYKKSNRVRVYNDLEFRKCDGHFDRGFCINVLSAIPSYSRRKQILYVLRRKLSHGGECLFVVQYRNSDFTRMRKLPNAKPFLDGFLINSLRGYSFYGMISPDHLEKSLKRAGFQIRETKLNEGTAYTWAYVP